jgi:hypothetical protein
VFCARCGREIDDASEICPQCGREATLSLPLSASMTTQQSSPSAVPNLMPAAIPPANRKEIGGWLMFFCILLIVVDPLFVMLIMWSAEPGPDNASYIVWAGLGTTVGIMIWNLYRHSFVWLWIYFGMTALLLAMRIADFAFVESNQNFHEITLIFRSAIYSIAWFLYFKRSDRVKTTFGRNL